MTKTLDKLKQAYTLTNKAYNSLGDCIAKQHLAESKKLIGKAIRELEMKGEK